MRAVVLAVAVCSIVLATSGQSRAQWTTSGSNINYTTGAVSVGTTWAGAQFNVIGATGGRFNYWMDVSGSICGLGGVGQNAYLNFADNVWTAAITHPSVGATGLTMGICAVGGGFIFNTYNGATTAGSPVALTERMRIDGSGNVTVAALTSPGFVYTNSSGRLTTNNRTTNVYAYGAVSGGSSSVNAPAINAALDAVGLAGGGTVQCDGTFAVNDTITIKYSNVRLVGSCTIIGDLAVTPILRVGDTAPPAAFDVTIEGITINRAAGAVPANSIGLQWYQFGRGYENTVNVKRSDTNRHYTNYVSPQSIKMTVVNPLSGSAQKEHILIEHVANIEFYGGELGNSGNPFNTLYSVRIINNANSVLFDGTTIIPRNPTDNFGTGFYFEDYADVGDIRLANVNLEDIDCGIGSNGGTAKIPSLSILDGRWTPHTSQFCLNSATRPVGWRITNGTFGSDATLVNPKWIQISNSFFGGNLALTVSSGTDSTAVVMGNTIAGALTVNGATYANRVVIGNTCGGSLTTTGTATKDATTPNAC